MILLISLILLLIGFVLLTKGADYFIDNAAVLAEEKGIPPHIVGVTIVAFGTSLPELLVSIISSLQGYNDLAIGNIVGSNISNIGLVLGTSCFIFFYLFNTNINPESDANSDSYVMFLAVILLYYFSTDKVISLTEGAVFFGMYVIYMYWLYVRSVNSDRDPIEQDNVSYIFLLGGLIALLLGAQLTVDSAVEIATYFGISEVVIGLSIVAIGTSLPELAGTVSAAKKGHKEIAVGNIIGSNIANIFMVMGILAIIKPIDIDDMILTTTMPLLMLITIATFGMIRVPMNRLSGLIFFSFFALFLYQLTL
ncbi:calcium/sodium antiporter [Euryarchaeota archaeon]|jgi:cation:H+ antiporter|nr:calcium/sodium antiporter [Euryarchaeota archaeon]